jgi:hypothetical protein
MFSILAGPSGLDIYQGQLLIFNIAPLGLGKAFILLSPLPYRKI